MVIAAILKSGGAALMAPGIVLNAIPAEKSSTFWSVDSSMMEEGIEG